MGWTFINELPTAIKEEITIHRAAIILAFFTGWFLAPIRKLFNNWVIKCLRNAHLKMKRFRKIKYIFPDEFKNCDLEVSYWDGVPGGSLPAIAVVPYIEFETKDKKLFADYPVEVFIQDRDERFDTRNYHYWLWYCFLPYKVKKISSERLPWAIIDDAVRETSNKTRKPYYHLRLDGYANLKDDLFNEYTFTVFITVNGKVKMKEEITYKKTSSYEDAKKKHRAREASRV